MKISFLAVMFVLFFFSSECFSQFDILDKVKEKAEEKIDEKIDEKVDEAFEEKEDTEADKDKEIKAEKVQNDEAEQINETQEKPAVKKEEFKSYSKFDFIPGEKIIYFSDFSYVETGDFPVDWNTNGTAEVVTISSTPGKWFKFGPDAFYTLALPDNLPENFTLEFDVVQNYMPGYGGSFNLHIFENTDDEFQTYVPGIGGVGLNFHSDRINFYNWLNQDYANIDNSVPIPMFENKNYEVIHYSMTRQKERIRFYGNEIKLIDVPKMFNKTLKLNMIRFVSDISIDPQQDVFVSNIRIAAGYPDMRSRLITEGKLVTTGITFDSGSDKIKPESYGTLKEIAAVLKENSGVRVKIFGHTDSDGDDNTNLELSKKRSASVKNALTSEFGIEASRMETDGKGEKEPASSNDTKEGKANNRRVEFVKL